VFPLALIPISEYSNSLRACSTNAKTAYCRSQRRSVNFKE
jgi:hypothetical protein